MTRRRALIRLLYGWHPPREGIEALSFFRTGDGLDENRGSEGTCIGRVRVKSQDRWMDARVQYQGSRSRFLTRRKQKKRLPHPTKTAAIIEAENAGRLVKREKKRAETGNAAVRSRRELAQYLTDDKRGPSSPA